MNKDERLVAWHFLPLRFAAAAAGGILYFLALPPVNWSVLILLPLGLLLLSLHHLNWLERLIAGFLFGLGWAFPAFWFLREIHPAVPFGIAPVLALWPACWALFAGSLSETLLYPVELRLQGGRALSQYIPSVWRRMSVTAILAAMWIILEFSRSTMLPWNNFSTACWRMPRILAITAFTGTAGIGFLIANLSLAAALVCRFRKDKRQFAWWFAAVLPAILLPLAASCGKTPVPPAGSIRIAAIQGDISQRRNADSAQAFEALRIYLELTRKAMQITPAPDLIIWPETAVPYAFRGTGNVCALYRQELSRLVQTSGIPVLFGTIEFKESFAHPGTYGITNSALLLTKEGIAARYDKIHRVPFGEYIPFRRLLPEKLTKAIDMNRDLTPGTDFAPLELKPEVRAGMAICFESVFPYVARESTRRGANMLLAISNDAWYPASSEPEQHLANAVARAVETGLYAVRCGNNGGTLLIRPDGTFEQVLTVPGSGRAELRRGRGIGILTVPVLPSHMTFYVRYGEWFTALCALAVIAGLLWAGYCFTAFHRELLARKESAPQA